jgi:hypothetical protein
VIGSEKNTVKNRDRRNIEVGLAVGCRRELVAEKGRRLV